MYHRSFDDNLREGKILQVGESGVLGTEFKHDYSEKLRGVETPVKKKKALANTLEKESAKRLQRATPK